MNTETTTPIPEPNGATVAGKKAPRRKTFRNLPVWADRTLTAVGAAGAVAIAAAILATSSAHAPAPESAPDIDPLPKQVVVWDKDLGRDDAVGDTLAENRSGEVEYDPTMTFIDTTGVGYNYTGTFHVGQDDFNRCKIGDIATLYANGNVTCKDNTLPDPS